MSCEVLFTVHSKYLEGESFVVREDYGYLWENFCNSMLIHTLSINKAMDYRLALNKLWENIHD